MASLLHFRFKFVAKPSKAKTSSEPIMLEIEMKIEYTCNTIEINFAKNKIKR